MIYLGKLNFSQHVAKKKHFSWKLKGKGIFFMIQGKGKSWGKKNEFPGIKLFFMMERDRERKLDLLETKMERIFFFMEREMEKRRKWKRKKEGYTRCEASFTMLIPW